MNAHLATLRALYADARDARASGIPVDTATIAYHVDGLTGEDRGRVVAAFDALLGRSIEAEVLRFKNRGRCHRCDGTGRVLFSGPIGAGRSVCPDCRGNR